MVTGDKFPTPSRASSSVTNNDPSIVTTWQLVWRLSSQRRGRAPHIISRARGTPHLMTTTFYHEIKIDWVLTSTSNGHLKRDYTSTSPYITLHYREEQTLKFFPWSLHYRDGQLTFTWRWILNILVYRAATLASDILTTAQFNNLSVSVSTLYKVLVIVDTSSIILSDSALETRESVCCL